MLGTGLRNESATREEDVFVLCLCRRLFVVRSHAHVRAHLKQDASSDVLGTYEVYFVLSPLGGLARFPYAQGNLPLFLFRRNGSEDVKPVHGCLSCTFACFAVSLQKGGPIARVTLGPEPVINVP